MTIRHCLFLALVLLVAGCDAEGGPETATVVDGVSNGYTLCDCVNAPPTTDTKVAACSSIIESMPYDVVATRSRECRKLIPVPAGGPDICYCISAESEDEDIISTCQRLIEKIQPAVMQQTILNCTIKRME